MTDEEEEKKPEEKEKEKEKVEEHDEEISPLERAEKINEENKKILEEIKEERIKMEKAAGDLKVSGRSFAGQGKQEPTEEERKKDGAIEFFKGTGIDKAIEKHG